MKCTSRNMRPILPCNDFRNGYNGYAIFDCKHLVGNNSADKLTAYLRNLVFGQLGIVMRAAAFVASFVRHICVIVGFSTKPEMGRIDTGGIVAGMANAHAFRDRAIVKFIAIAMHKYQFTIESDLSITSRAKASSPFPTSVRSGLVDLFPESFRQRAASPMSLNKPIGLTCNASCFLIAKSGDWCRLTAATFAKVCRNLAWGTIEGHDDLQSLCHATGRSQRRGGAFVGFVQE